jgi:hypothetical protein
LAPVSNDLQSPVVDVVGGNASFRADDIGQEESEIVVTRADVGYGQSRFDMAALNSVFNRKRTAKFIGSPTLEVSGSLADIDPRALSWPASGPTISFSK